MSTKQDNSVAQSRQPVQFSLSKLLQVMSVAAMWCAAGVVRGSVLLAVAYALVTAIATWIVVGRWAVSLSPKACRRVLAGTTTLLVAGGLGVTLLVESDQHMPLLWLPTAMLAALPFAMMHVEGGWGIAAAIAWGALSLFLVYFIWLAIFHGWDRLSDRSNQRRLSGWFSGLIMLLALPLLFAVFNGCYTFSGHGQEPGEIRHLWIHCVVHVGMLAAAAFIVVKLRQHARLGTTPPSNWLKLVTLGYLCLYAVLLQVALFPIHFYIP